jgi:hypothetical protein
MAGHYARTCPFKLKKPTLSKKKDFHFQDFKNIVENYGTFTNGMVNAILKEKLQAKQVIQLIKLNDSSKMFRSEYASRRLREKLEQINEFYDRMMDWDSTIYLTQKEKDKEQEKKINASIENKIKNKIVESNINEIVKNKIDNIKEKVSNETIRYEKGTAMGKYITSGTRMKVEGEAGVRNQINKELINELGKLSLDEDKSTKSSKYSKNNKSFRTDYHNNGKKRKNRRKNNKPPEPNNINSAQTQEEQNKKEQEIVKQPKKIIFRKGFNTVVTSDGIEMDEDTFNKYYYNKGD